MPLLNPKNWPHSLERLRIWRDLRHVGRRIQFYLVIIKTVLLVEEFVNC